MRKLNRLSDREYSEMMQKIIPKHKRMTDEEYQKMMEGEKKNECKRIEP